MERESPTIISVGTDNRPGTAIAALCNPFSHTLSSSSDTSTAASLFCPPRRRAPPAHRARQRAQPAPAPGQRPQLGYPPRDSPSASSGSDLFRDALSEPLCPHRRPAYIALHFPRSPARFFARPTRTYHHGPQLCLCLARRGISRRRKQSITLPPTVRLFSVSRRPLLIFSRTRSVPRLDLHSAAATGNLGLVKFAINNGQPINSVLDGVLPLHAACAGGSEVVVRYLISMGADVNAQRCALTSFPLCLYP